MKIVKSLVAWFSAVGIGLSLCSSSFQSSAYSFEKGDIDHNARIDSDDMKMIKHHLLLDPDLSDRSEFDINNNDSADCFDLIRIKRMIIYNRTDFSAPDIDWIDDGTTYTILNSNVPYFQDTTIKIPFETYSELDPLGRCQEAYANVCRELMPTEERENISSVIPSGYSGIEYDDIDGKKLYNRCHLIAFSLTGENANPQNLITGTRYFNVKGMLPFEEKVANYVRKTNNHVLYRVTPVFKENDLVAQGVIMEAYSVEDEGQGIQFNVFCYNIQPGIEINYLTGESKSSGSNAVVTTAPVQTTPPLITTSIKPIITEPYVSTSPVSRTYVLNTYRKKFHYPDCGSVNQMSEKNRQYVEATRDEIIAQGYSPCGNCRP